MKNYKKLKKYSVHEINGIMDSLREQYDIVRLVDVEECRILQVLEDGEINYGKSCFQIWNRSNRCANCTSYRACMTRRTTDKMEHLGRDKESVHSIPVYLEMNNGESELCVIECVRHSGTEGKGYQEEQPAEYINTHDVLTRLYTQEKLLREIRLRLNRYPDEDYLVVVINIRNFAVVNRLFGIDGGNCLLTGIADILRKECSSEEVYGRCHDDRFALLIKKSRFHEEIFMEHIRSAEKLLDSPVFTVQLKLGVYEIQSRNMPVSKMIEYADTAVNTIRNSREEMLVYFTADMMERRMNHERIVSDFEVALKNEEFTIYLQPQVREDGTVKGGEALVRWIRPDGTMVLPGDFLHVLHQSELLSYLDTYIWEQAVRLLCQWKGTEFQDLYLSINVDPTDFYYVDVPEVLRSLCRKYAVNPNMLRVEITETALVEDIENQNRMVERLHDAGFMVEIDDFGKGFSSLSMLKDICADVLKVDMGFVQENHNAERSEVILESVIKMAKNLNMGVITEGVETRAQMEKLSRLGCHNFQGFYFSRPIPVKDFEMVITEKNL